MDAVVTALAEGARRGRRLRIGLGVLTTTAIAGVAWGWIRYEAAQREAACISAGNAIDEVWSDEARARVERGLVDSGAPDAQTTARKLMPWIDRHVETWRGHARAACGHATIERDWDEELYDKAGLCLDDRRVELEDFIEDMTVVDAPGAWSAVERATRLAPTLPCIDRATLAATPAVPVETREGRRVVRRMLSEVAAARSSGSTEVALERARDAIESAQSLGLPGLVATAQRSTALCLQDTDDLAQSEAMMLASYNTAARAGAWEAAALAAIDLTYQIGYVQHRPEQGLQWGEHAATALVHAGDPSGLVEAERLRALAAVANRQGRFGEAIEHNQRARTILERVVGKGHPHVAACLGNEANNHRRRGENEQALRKHQASLAIRREALGPNHPEVASALSNLANVYWSMDRLEDAKALYEEALGIQVAATGESHRDVAKLLRNLGLTQRGLGEHEAARVSHQRAPRPPARGLRIRTCRGRRRHAGARPDDARARPA